ncbi:hypothetical protein Tco_0819235 [Tanacetum coccineum]|uniref:Uncharacterized protein n=1 Tax=Tanacetum coccineum TaxID=301880 RepID=A0ABQ5AAB2_9ASTR
MSRRYRDSRPPPYGWFENDYEYGRFVYTGHSRQNPMASDMEIHPGMDLHLTRWSLILHLLLSSPSTPSPQPTAQSPIDALLASRPQIFVYEQIRGWLRSCWYTGVARLRSFNDGSKEKGDGWMLKLSILVIGCTAPFDHTSGTNYNITMVFQANHEDAYD